MTSEAVVTDWLMLFMTYLELGIGFAALLLWFALQDSEVRQRMTPKAFVKLFALVTLAWPYFGWQVVRRLPGAIRKALQEEKE